MKDHIVRDMIIIEIDTELGEADVILGPQFETKSPMFKADILRDVIAELGPLLEKYEQEVQRWIDDLPD
jgi:hypothetical protein